MIEMDDGARLRTWTAGPAIPQRLPLVMLHGGPGALSWFTDYADRARAWDWALAAARTLRPVNYAMNTQLNAAKKAVSGGS